MDTMNIKGKLYITVNERVKHFRDITTGNGFDNWSIETDIYSITDTEVITKTYIRDLEGRVIATGLAHEVKGSSNVNSTSHIENCETSSVGRALGMLGIGIDTSLASADEVKTAIHRQESQKPVRDDSRRVVSDNKPQQEVNKEYRRCDCGNEVEGKVSKAGNMYFKCDKCDAWVNDYE